MPPPNPGPPAAKLINELADKIYAKIVSGELPPGSRLKQEVLASQFSVSRTPIREALSRLEARGVVSQAQHRSAVVRAPSGREVTEMYQVRAELEGLAAQLAARWISDQQLVALRFAHDEFVAAVRAMREPGYGARPGTRKKAPGEEVWEVAAQRWIGLNAVFHKAIGEASNNDYLARTIQELSSGYSRALVGSSANGLGSFRVDANVTWHEKILRALEEREPARARKAMTEHIIEAGEVVSALFDRIG